MYAFGIIAILLIIYFISAMACGWTWAKCKSSTPTPSPTPKSFFAEVDIKPEMTFLYKNQN